LWSRTATAEEEEEEELGLLLLGLLGFVDAAAGLEEEAELQLGIQEVRKEEAVVADIFF
jgi:hypothetical protein